MQFYMRQFATKKYLAIGGALLVLVLLALFSLSRTSNRVPAQQFEPTFEYVSHEGPGYRMEYPGWWMREAFEGGMFVTNEYGSARVIVKVSDADTSPPFGAIRETMLRDPAYTADFTIRPGGDPGYVAYGSRRDREQIIGFTELGFDVKGKRYQLLVEDETGGNYAEILGNIIATFRIVDAER